MTKDCIVVKNHFVCPRCDKDCTNKQGLISHLKKCGISVSLTCEHCHSIFKSKANLTKHFTTCKVYKNLLTEQIQQSTETALKSSYELRIEELKKIIETQQKDHDSSISSLRNKYNETIHILKQEHINEIQNTIKELKQDRECQVKLRETDLISVTNELNKIKEDHVDIINERDSLKRKVEDNEREIRYLSHKALDLTSQLAMSSLGSTNITNTNISQVQNNVQLQMFDPSVIKGRIHPPDMMISNVPQLVNHLFRLGAGNYFRVTDKSRYNTIWNKPGRGQIKDASCTELSNYIVDTLVDEIQTQQAHWEVELSRLMTSPDPDMYRVNETQQNIRFCRNLLDREDELMKELQRTIAQRGKNKGDTSIDQVYEISYYKIINAISFALLPHIDVWFEMSFYKLGRYLGSLIKDYYHVEGGSRENRFIIIQDDHDGTHLIYAEKLQELIHEALMPKIFHHETKDILQYILTKCCTIKLDVVEQTLNYIESPTIGETEEIMRGIVSL
jgi:hypothetical protein